MPTETWYRLPDARREAVLAAAEAEFVAHGFSRGSLNVIAREAGVAKGSLFQYFDDKADLFVHLSDIAADRVDVSMAEASRHIDWSQGFFPAYTELIQAWVRHFRTHPIDRELSAAVSLEPDPDARTAVRAVIDRRYVEFLRPLLESAKDDGWLRPDADVDAFIALLVLVLPHLALAPTYAELDPVLGLGGDDPDDGVRRLMAVFEAAFGATGATGEVTPAI
jgi:AcrR family transcriptional regulator